MKRNLLIFILFITFIVFYYPLIKFSFAQGTVPPVVIYLPVVTNIILTATPNPTSIPLPTPGALNIVIKTVFYDGEVPRVESDEFAEIENIGAISVNIGGWRLYAGDDDQNFFFPDFTIAPGQIVRVYTNQIHPETGGFSFHSQEAIWNNSGDCGYLYMADRTEVFAYCYP